MPDKIVALRTPSGISGDMLVTGLSRLAACDEAAFARLIDAIALPALSGTARIVPASVGGISGWRAEIALPHEHAHRPYAEIRDLIQQSRLSPGAQERAIGSFALLAEVEGRIHGIATDKVEFHEIGALDSILDICLAAALLDRLAPVQLVCSPLPLCDGVVRCAHGLLATPTPAVQEMLAGIPVYGIESSGETVTPTALAFLRAAGARFGAWPSMIVERTARAYGGRILPGVPNGAIFVLGMRAPEPTRPSPLEHGG